MWLAGLMYFVLEALKLIGGTVSAIIFPILKRVVSEPIILTLASPLKEKHSTLTEQIILPLSSTF